LEVLGQFEEEGGGVFFDPGEGAGGGGGGLGAEEGQRLKGGEEGVEEAVAGNGLDDAGPLFLLDGAGGLGGGGGEGDAAIFSVDVDICVGDGGREGLGLGLGEAVFLQGEAALEELDGFFEEGDEGLRGGVGVVEGFGEGGQDLCGVAGKG